MQFLRGSFTLLLVATVFSLTSILTTQKANAQEIQGQESCPMTPFLFTAKNPCKTQPQTASEFIQNVKNPKKEIKPSEKDSVKVAFVQQEVSTTEAQMTPSEAPGQLSADVLFGLVNQYRQSVGLPAFERDSQVCGVAESRRLELSNEIFVTHNLHAGFYAKNLPYWATENMIWQHTEAESLNWWLHSPIHRSAIEGNYKYACGVCVGEVCNMVFTNYEPKIAIVPQETPSAATPPNNEPKVTTPVSSTASSVADKLTLKLN